MIPNQNQKQNSEAKDKDTGRLNIIPHNLPVKPREKSTVTPTNVSPTKEPKSTIPSLEEQITPSSASQPTSPTLSSSSITQKTTLPKKSEASNYGRTTVKSLRTYEKDVEEAKRRANKSSSHKTGQKKEEKIPQKESLIPKNVTEKVPQKNTDDTRETIRKKAIEQELAQSGITPTKAEKTEEVEKKTSISPIKTFRNDAATEVKENNLSVVSIAVAQNKKRVAANREKPPRQESHLIRNLSVILISLVLIGSGSGLAWFFYQKSLEGRTVAIETSILSIIFANFQKEIDVTEIQEGLLTVRESAEQPGINGTTPNTVLHLYHTKISLGESKLLSAQEFLSRVSPNIPDRLIRSVREDYMLGQYVTDVGNNPFLILKTDSFENTFASMLEWEETMQSDLAPFFGEILGNLSTTPSSNGTSSPRAQIIIPRIFHDVIVKNIDTRLLRSDDGDVALLYAFPNVNTLIITANEDTFFEVFKRLTTSR